MARSAGWRRWRHFVAPTVIWLVVVGLAAVGLVLADRGVRDRLTDRFSDRVVIGSGFVSSFVADAMAREVTQARSFLSGDDVGQAEFDRLVATFGYPAAILLDGDGRVMRLVPAQPAMVGVDLATRYAHLRAAVRQGRPVVSDVVPSAVRGVPVVAFAVAFDTPTGRRVFSGAVEVHDSPLGAYLDHAIALPNAHVLLVDSVGNVAASNQLALPGITPLTSAAPELAAALRVGSTGGYQALGRPWRFVSRPVVGTGWHLVAAVPDEELFSPGDGARRWGIGAVTALALVGILAVVLSARVRRNRHQLRESEERFRGIFDGSLLGMATTTPQGRILRVNRALCDILGREPPDTLHHDIREFTHPDDADASAAADARVGAGHTRGYRAERRYVRPDGEEVSADVTNTLMGDLDGRPAYFVTAILDITARKRLEEAERQARRDADARTAELEQANDRIRDLVAMLSHDIRQPLQVAYGYTTTLREDWQDTAERDKLRQLDRVVAALQRMNEFITGILAMSQADSGVIAAHRRAVDVVGTVAEVLGSLTGEHAVAVRTHLPDDATALVDPQHLRQILTNLLTNAAKYGLSPVTLTVDRSAEAVTVTVSDEGPGVPEEFVDHMFDRFTRAAATAGAPGTGIGLYIVRELARANGAGITYRPNVPSGASFVLRLPTPDAAATVVDAAVGGPGSPNPA